MYSLMDRYRKKNGLISYSFSFEPLMSYVYVNKIKYFRALCINRQYRQNLVTAKYVFSSI